jgi:hypothetical protein
MKIFALSAILLGSTLYAQQTPSPAPKPPAIADLTHEEQTTLENYELKKQVLDSKVQELKTQVQEAYTSLNKEAQTGADAIIASHKETGKVVFDPNTFTLAPVQAAPKVSQTSHGAHSPNISNVNGNVNVAK